MSLGVLTLLHLNDDAIPSYLSWKTTLLYLNNEAIPQFPLMETTLLLFLNDVAMAPSPSHRNNIASVE